MSLLGDVIEAELVQAVSTEPLLGAALKIIYPNMYYSLEDPVDCKRWWRIPSGFVTVPCQIHE